VSDTILMQNQFKIAGRGPAHARTPDSRLPMNALRIPLRVVFYKDNGEWVAHCLEFDLVGSGATKPDALAGLSDAIRIQVEESVANDNPRNLFSPADGEYFQRFAAGKEIAQGELELRIDPIDSVVIERTETREYTDGVSDEVLIPA
jgi:predicted RNase H-like HicB family nuclease